MRRILFGLVAVSVVVVLVSSSGAGAGAEATGGVDGETAAAAATGTINGTIRSNDGRPIVGPVQVSVLRFRDNGTIVQFAGVTTADGTYSATGLIDGTYRIRFSPQIFENGEAVYQSEYWDDSRTFDGARNIVIAGGSTFTADATLTAFGQIVGSITGSDGSPYGDLPVVVYRHNPATSGWDRVTSRTTAPQYVIALDAGTYRLCAFPNDGIHRAECWDDVATIDEAADLEVTERGSVRADIRLDRGGSIAGTVRDLDTGDGVYYSTITVYAHDAATDSWTSSAALRSQTGPAGEYVVGGLPPGRYRVCAAPYDDVHRPGCHDHADRVETATDLVIGDGTTLGDVDIHVGPGGTLAGTISGMPAGVQGEIRIQAFRVTDGGLELMRDASLCCDGPYRVGGLPTGDYRFCVESIEYEVVPAFARECWNGAPNEQSGTDIPVVVGQTTEGVDVHVDLEGRIRGRVVGVDDPVLVQLFTSEGKLALERRTDPTTGRFEFAGLPPADYRLGVNLDRGVPGFAGQFYRGVLPGHGPEGATPIPVAPLAVVSLGDIRLVPLGPTTISLSIDPARPVAGERLALTAVVRPVDPAEPEASGMVDFLAGDIVLGSAPLGSPAVLVLETGLPAGIHRLTAVFRGSDRLASSTTEIRDVEVRPAGPTPTTAPPTTTPATTTPPTTTGPITTTPTTPVVTIRPVAPGGSVVAGTARLPATGAPIGALSSIGVVMLGAGLCAIGLSVAVRPSYRPRHLRVASRS